MDGACVSCVFFDELYRISTEFGRELFAGVASGLLAVLPGAVLAWLLFTAATILLGKPPGDSLRAMATTLLSVFLVILTLQDPDLYWGWIYTPIETTALDIGAYIIGTLAGGTGFDLKPAANGYSGLLILVEQQVYGIIKLAGSMLSAWSPLRSIMAIIMLLPYLFVFGIFLAFMIEALFKFLSMTVLAPLWLVGLPFRPTRPFGVAALRILLGAGLTIVFASAAMGLTVSVVDEYRDVIEAMLRFEIDSAEWARVCGGPDASPLCPAKPGFDPSSKPVIMTVLIGFVSILLHLQAKALASNISGANDGAGPAAATVAAAKATLGFGLLAGQRSLFGRAGLGGNLGRIPGMAHFQQHGAVGGTAASAAQLIEHMRTGRPPGETPPGFSADDRTRMG